MLTLENLSRISIALSALNFRLTNELRGVHDPRDKQDAKNHIVDLSNLRDVVAMEMIAVTDKKNISFQE